MGEKELIYRADVRRALLRNYPEAAHCIERIRAVEVKEVVRGRWLYEPVEFAYKKDIKCSVCGEYVNSATNYCPTCGAEMIGAESDGRM